MRGSKVESIESEFNKSPDVKPIQLVDSVKDEYLLRVEWVLEHDDVLPILAETKVLLIEAHWSTTNRDYIP